ncbi:hypothetical protein F5X68DRAFT_249234 [Plectosphaerella plurivora]|uniref:Uncharacterized protein n=1 Tax=Plectosphaerella plurivora TaxID=936078 RepID=A0A9P9A4C7_9PEZI|nr:hypothetical protein F5X68DRAFT_249234 [Plectosphaerella plurivora]
MSDWLRHFQRPKAEATDDENLKETQDAPSTTIRPLGSLQPDGCANLASEESSKNPSTLDDTSTLEDVGDDYFKKSADDKWSCPRDIDDIWHQPTLEQISETLFVALMNKSHLEPIPLEYDTWVQQLVRGCADLSRDLRATKQLLAEEKETKNRSIEAFTQMSMDWEERETAYKAEIRRMEVLLAKTAPSGVEAVLVARSGSIVDRSLAGTKRFRASVQKARGAAFAISNITSGPSQGYQDANSFQKDNAADERNTQQHLVLQEPLDKNSGTICDKSLPSLDSANVQGPDPATPDHTILEQAKVEATEGVHDVDRPASKQTIKQKRRSYTEPSMIHHAAGHELNQVDNMARQSPRGNGQPLQTARHGRAFSFNPGVEKLSLPNMRAPMDHSQDAPSAT